MEEYFDFHSLRRLLDFSDRVTTRVDIPSASTLNGWLRGLLRDSGPNARESYAVALEKSPRVKAPFRAVFAAPGTPPPALALALARQAPRTEQNHIPGEDARAFLDTLNVWETRTLHKVLGGNSFDTSPFHPTPRNWAPIDITDQSPPEKRKRVRDWDKITGIVLHQTGIHGFGEKAWKKTTAHLGVHSDGRVFQIHPLESYLWSSHGLNRDTVAIEVAGNFLGDEKKPNSYWKKGGGPSTLDEVMISSLRQTIRWIVDEVADHGGNVSYIYAHRQASKDRPICPGAAIWKQGGVWAQIELRLSNGGPGYTRGDGQPIPDHWDPRQGDEPDYVPEGTDREGYDGPGDRGPNTSWAEYLDEYLTVRNILLGGLALTGLMIGSRHLGRSLTAVE